MNAQRKQLNLRVFDMHRPAHCTNGIFHVHKQRDTDLLLQLRACIAYTYSVTLSQPADYMQ